MICSWPRCRQDTSVLLQGREHCDKHQRLVFSQISRAEDLTAVLKRLKKHPESKGPVVPSQTSRLKDDKDAR